MFLQDDTNEQNWGMILNVRRVYSYNKFPEWANKLQKEKYTERGLVVWDDTAKQVVNLKARHILRILDELKATPDLINSGIIIGEPAASILLDSPEKDYKYVLTNQIPLSCSQTRQFFELIEQNEGSFNNMAKEEKEEELDLLARVYEHILSDKWGRKEPEENDE